MRLVDADALKDRLEDLRSYTALNKEQAYYKGETNALKIAIRNIENAPTVCVPQDTPLKCRTCSFFVNADGLCMINGLGRCSMFGGERSADDYCSKGAWLSNATN